jgi:hypothetical protein
MKHIYAINHNKFIDNIVISKRLEIANIINSYIKKFKAKEVTDIGTTSDLNNASSNLVIKKLIGIKKFKSVSDQNIKARFFKYILKKSITKDLTYSDIKIFSSDLILSSATIEHVGSYYNQTKMIKNIIKLTKKFFVITTPNRFYPLDFHTKIPFIHWLPKKIHRTILKIINLNYFSEEKNLNLLSERDIVRIMNSFKGKIKYNILFIRLFGIKSNFIIIGYKKYC